MDNDSERFEANWLRFAIERERIIRIPPDVIAEGRKRIAVIGAGISGLCSLKHLLEKPQFSPVVFEQNSKVGGVWYYTRNAFNDDGTPSHSGVYENLMTNGPKELMMFPGFPHDQKRDSYLHHKQMFDYIEQFTDFHEMKTYIKFNTVTTNIRPVKGDNNQINWNVTYCERHSPDVTETEIFDGVIVCNGHYAKGIIPDIEGINHFTGDVIHSKEYRRPDVYKGKRVLIIGASFSGMDISFDVAKTAKQVYMSHRHEAYKTELPSNVLQRLNVRQIAEGNKVVFKDGSEANIDSIILCTGYSYDFPFLADDVMQVRNERLTPLYKHLVHIKYPNLLFVGIPKCVSYFIQAHEQARAAVAILEGHIQLPSEQEMLKDAEEDFRQKKNEFNLTELQAHYMGKGDLQWRLNEAHAKLCGFDKLPQVFADMQCSVQKSRSADFGAFRKINYFFKDSKSFGIQKIN
ncbi:Flavin-containing monooxygenase FMO GS-OX3 [Mizuhopecten yessoensis]|uniref:Flavin-containing monooxygenase n=1 Tax=Mizuhopecten yessoensis TaxID=6573 RepID=A0A210QYM0_MIZYE|nr:Flavin-containing monooxygenase FMO GS-OX3 [Mizuhopecten yessoensis]